MHRAPRYTVTRWVKRRRIFVRHLENWIGTNLCKLPSASSGNGRGASIAVLVRREIVVMDKVGVHKVAGVREAINARGLVLLYLPPDSPDLNPIEQFFSKFKVVLRKVAARSIEGLWSVVGSCLAEFSPRECAAYLANVAYGQPCRKMR
jgi:hypothetical protein